MRDSDILGGVGYRNALPFLDIIRSTDDITPIHPRNIQRYAFDTTVRSCVGWYDMEARARHACPENTKTTPRYDTFPACQKRTGFNPAFYHAATLSPQQEKRNTEPHALYLAYFAPGITKVGIAHAPRVYDRLLEQGARYAYILEKAPSALVARSHEVAIAVLPAMKESVQASVKQQLLTAQLSVEAAKHELDHWLEIIAADAKLQFDVPTFVELDQYYFFDKPRILSTATGITSQRNVIGDPFGMIGSTLLLQHGDRLVYFNLKKYTGYAITPAEALSLKLTPEQTTLF